MLNKTEYAFPTLFIPRQKSQASVSSNIADDVAIPDAMQADFSLADTISAIDRQYEDGPGAKDDVFDDVLPQAAEGMGSGINLPISFFFFILKQVRLQPENL